MRVRRASPSIVSDRPCDSWHIFRAFNIRSRRPRKPTRSHRKNAEPADSTRTAMTTSTISGMRTRRKAGHDHVEDADSDRVRDVPRRGAWNRQLGGGQHAAIGRRERRDARLGLR
jgi:hypothetical protein